MTFRTGGGSASASALVPGGSAGQVVYIGAGDVLTGSANLTLDNTNKRLTVGTGSSTSAGWHLGYYGSSGNSAMWSTAVTPSGTNYAIFTSGSQTQIAGSAQVDLVGGTAIKLTAPSTANRGPIMFGAQTQTANTFANLPATPVTGMIAVLSDGTSVTPGANVAGGGANTVVIWRNASNWVVLGA